MLSLPTADTLRAQLAADGRFSENVLNAIHDIPRTFFVPEAFQDRAFENSSLPIGLHQTISQPTVVALMTEALQLDDRQKVLEIGTGSGYQTSILSKLCRRVYSLERHKPLLAKAEERFRQLGLTNVVARFGDGSMGWKEQAPFSRIIVTAAAIDVPEVLLDQLDVGGIMIVPVGLDERTQELLKITKHEDDIVTEELGEVRFVPLISDEEGG